MRDDRTSNSTNHEEETGNQSRSQKAGSTKELTMAYSCMAILYFLLGTIQSLHLLYSASSLDKIRSITQQTVMPSLLIIAVEITVMIIFLIWVHRTGKNNLALGASGMKFSPSWAWVSFLIPIANLILPLMVMKELWKTSSNPTDWRQERAPLRITWWWILTLLHIVPIIIGQFFLQKWTGIHDESSLFPWFIFLALLTIVLRLIALLLILNIINRISSMQDSLLTRQEQ